MSDLGPAYDEAIKRLALRKGGQLAQIVRTTLEQKQILDSFERTVGSLEIEQWLQQQLIGTMANQITESVSTMCLLIGKMFKRDILPCIEEVEADAQKNSKRYLQ